MIEAQSIGQLLQLVDDPPLHYRVDLENRPNDLTLYVARVPGSKDLFLTTIKPLDKVVRAADVESCLYYIHLSTDRDADLLREAEDNLAAERPNNISPPNGVIEQRNAVKRKPILPSHPGLSPSIDLKSTSMPHVPSNSDPKHPSGIKRKPITTENKPRGDESPGRRPMGPRPVNKPDLGLKPRDMNVNDDQKIGLSLPTLHHAAKSTINIDPYESKRLELRSIYDSNASIDNPSAGFRSSVGDLSFVHPVTVIRRYGGSQLNIGQVEPGGVIWLFGNGYQKFMKEPQALATHPGPSIYRTSLMKAGSAPLGFLTPWNTSCHFTSNIGGRAIQCLHDQVAGTDPSLVSELRFNLPSSKALRSDPRRPVSESGEHSKRASFMRLHQRGKSETIISQSDSHGSNNLREEKMDLSLGQELAGGGFSGKQAKIAKLILHPEGFPMIDLLVAANVSILWKIYERDGIT